MQIIPHTDLFAYPGDCRIITVNTVGAMGAGIAKDWRNRYWKEYHAYKRQCRGGFFHLGVPQLVTTEDDLHWLLFPTKQDWRNFSRYEWIHAGLGYIIDNIGEPDYIDPNWKLIFPPLGCGHGCLEFHNIIRYMDAFDSHVPNDVTLIAPQGYQLLPDR